MPSTHQQVAAALDRFWTRPLFFAAFLFLVVLAGAGHRLKDPLISDLEIYLIVGSLVTLWPLFLVEAVVRFMFDKERSLWRRVGYSFLLLLMPPLHLGSKGYARTDELWLPFLGWRPVDRHLRRKLEQIFGIPMIVLALLTLPLLAMELYWREPIAESPGLSLFIDLSTSFIWLVFAVEFILMVSVAERKLTYMARHWVDMLIVLLPIIDVLPALRSMRAFQVLRMQQVTRLGRAYRLRAVAMKLWRAMLLLEVIQRLTGWTPEKRLLRLRELQRAKEEELADLREEIDRLEKQVAEKKETPAAEQDTEGKRAAVGKE
jgi:voltage-gated potassium channel